MCQQGAGQDAPTDPNLACMSAELTLLIWLKICNISSSDPLASLSPFRPSSCVCYVTYSHHSFLDLSKIFIFQSRSDGDLSGIHVLLCSERKSHMWEINGGTVRRAWLSSPLFYHQITVGSALGSFYYIAFLFFAL